MRMNWFLGVMNQKTKQIDIEVFDEEGNHMYTLPTGVVVNEEEGRVNDRCLLMILENLIRGISWEYWHLWADVI